MSAPGVEILWASKFRKNDMSNDSELVSQDPEIYNNIVSGITGIVCAPIVFALFLLWCYVNNP